jgi:hypothetical protein
MHIAMTPYNLSDFYPCTRQIDIIEKHKELEEHCRKRNDIVNIDIDIDSKDYLEFLKV